MRRLGAFYGTPRNGTVKGYQVAAVANSQGEEIDIGELLTTVNVFQGEQVFVPVQNS